jgi:hypothetical protein
VKDNTGNLLLEQLFLDCHKEDNGLELFVNQVVPVFKKMLDDESPNVRK